MTPKKHGTLVRFARLVPADCYRCHKEQGAICPRKQTRVREQHFQRPSPLPVTSAPAEVLEGLSSARIRASGGLRPLGIESLRAFGSAMAIVL